MIDRRNTISNERTSRRCVVSSGRVYRRGTRGLEDGVRVRVLDPTKPSSERIKSINPGFCLRDEGMKVEKRQPS